MISLSMPAWRLFIIQAATPTTAMPLTATDG